MEKKFMMFLSFQVMKGKKMFRNLIYQQNQQNFSKQKQKAKKINAAIHLAANFSEKRV